MFFFNLRIRNGSRITAGVFKTISDVTVFVNIKFIAQSKNYTFLLFLTKDI